MARWTFLWFLLLGTAAAFTVVDFPTYLDGPDDIDDKMHKVAAELRKLDADVVALQEFLNETMFKDLVDQLGVGWSGVYHCGASPTPMGIVTKHTILPFGYAHTRHGLHALIQKGDRRVSVWSVHLPMGPYGPYTAQDQTEKNVKALIEGESDHWGDRSSKMNAMEELLSNADFEEQMHKSDSIPVIVAGVFNTPSDQDWIDANKEKHFGMAVEWPVPKMLRTRAMMRDSFREVHPDPVKEPGNTWSTIVKSRSETQPEPQDRVSFIFYRGPLKPLNSTLYAGAPGTILKPKDGNGQEKHNTWPSDFYALITDFKELPVHKSSVPDIRAKDKSLPSRCGEVHFAPFWIETPHAA